VKRREFIAGLGSAAAWPVAVRAQQRALPVVGYLHANSEATVRSYVAAFQQGLKVAGYVAGENLEIEYRWGEDQYGRLPGLAADLVRRRMAVIVANGVEAAVAAKAATTKIPIVFETGIDPVKAGLVASLNRPGGNLTGVTNLNVGVLPKLLQLLHEMVPSVTTIGLLVNPTNHFVEPALRDARAAAGALGLQLHILHANAERDFDAVFASLTEVRAGALIIAPDAFFTSRSEQLAALTLRHAIPAAYQFYRFSAAGGLLSYGGDVTEAYKLAGIYTGRILRGEKPADLPVQQATKVELTINMKTAKALRLTVPETLAATANKVIE
jgi:putative tryptophan/tyrosine transport system substrate-binding protein